MGPNFQAILRFVAFLILEALGVSMYLHSPAAGIPYLFIIAGLVALAAAFSASNERGN